MHKPSQHLLNTYYVLEIMLQSAHSVLFCWQFLHYILLVFQDRVSLCNPGCPETHSVDQAGLELRNLPASACQVLGLKVCATTVQHTYLVLL